MSLEEKKRSNSMFSPHPSWVWPLICRFRGTAALCREDPEAGKETFTVKWTYTLSMTSEIVDLFQGFLQIDLFYLLEVIYKKLQRKRNHHSCRTWWEPAPQWGLWWVLQGTVVQRQWWASPGSPLLPPARWTPQHREESSSWNSYPPESESVG